MLQQLIIPAPRLHQPTLFYLSAACQMIYKLLSAVGRDFFGHCFPSDTAVVCHLLIFEEMDHVVQIPSSISHPH